MDWIELELFRFESPLLADELVWREALVVNQVVDIAIAPDNARQPAQIRVRPAAVVRCFPF
jgi:hypothetical protein